MQVETVEGTKQIEIKALGGITATQLLARLIRSFGKPVGKFMQANGTTDLAKLNLDSIPFEILDPVELECSIRALLSKSTIDGKAFDPDVMFAGCPDQMLVCAFEALKLNYGGVFKRLVTKKP